MVDYPIVGRTSRKDCLPDRGRPGASGYEVGQMREDWLEPFPYTAILVPDADDRIATAAWAGSGSSKPTTSMVSRIVIGAGTTSKATRAGRDHYQASIA